MVRASELRRVLSTVRHLRLRQVQGQVARRTGWKRPAFRAVPVTRRPGPGIVPFLAPLEPAARDGLAFLNAPAMPLGSIDWRSPSRPKLWRYNLHYFDYLLWPSVAADAKARLLGSWLAGNPPGTADAWEPYPLSLRVVNWIKYWLSGTAPTAAELASLAGQLGWLRQDLEYHLLANHLLKNGKALFFGGVFFDGAAARDWLDTGLDILLAEADEQVLPDGGHYERSPMYHCIVLEDLLDVVQLARHFPGLVPAAAVDRLVAAAARAARFLDEITAGDGRIPLFNDAAYGITREPPDLLAYARQVLGADAPPPVGNDVLRAVALPDTGYFGYRRGRDSLLIDCGPVGPDYQPGHAHCDTLSYELCVDGERVVVDAGVYSYEADEFRRYVRSTTSHNTVVVDDAEQSEIWAAFRVGRRARPVGPALAMHGDGSLAFEGGHDGYRRLPGRPVHRRRLRVDPGGSWTVLDHVDGSGAGVHRIESRVHLQPDFGVVPGPDRDGRPTFLLQHKPGTLRLRLTVTAGSPGPVEQGYHCPEFGVCLNNNVIVIRQEGRFPLETGYTIERL